MTLTHTRQQQPVGQGFFHSGELELGYAHFRYVYDCGSENVAALRQRIDSYVEEERPPGPLDILFVSHLDRDHVNGLDRFLTLTSVDTVVLPYLSDVDVFALVAAGCVGGNVDADFIQFLGDPVRWLGDRGARRVIFFSGNTSDFPETPGPQLPEGPGLPDGAEVIGLNFADLAAASDEQWDQDSPLLGQSVQVFVLPHEVPLALQASGRVLNWGFISFVHPDFDRQEKFRQEIEGKFPGIDLKKDKTKPGRYRTLCEILQDPEKRTKLADCYHTIRKDRNLTSMSIYSGPFRMKPEFACSWSLHTVDSEVAEPISERCAWIGTGDANLRSERRRNAFRRHFSRVLGYVRTMSLPHHGSRHNFSPALLESGPPVFVASAGASGRYGHPHDDVLLKIRAKRRRYFVTTEDPVSTVLETVEMPPVSRGEMADLLPSLIRLMELRRIAM